MNPGDNHELAVIEELTKRVRSLEEKLEQSWEALRPAQAGGLDLPTDEEVKRLAFELKGKRSEVTDLKKLHMVDMVLHFFSVWPVLPQDSRHYAFNMARLLNVALTEGWSEAAQQSNGFSLQLITPVPNGLQTPVARGSTIAAGMNGINALPSAGTPVAASTSGTASAHTLQSASMASPPRVKVQSPPGTPVKREAPDEAVNPTSPKVANCASTSSASTPHNATLSSPYALGPSPLTYKPKCKCEQKQPAHRLQVKKESENKGRYFYKCFKHSVMNPVNPCNYFEWEDQLPIKAPKLCSNCSKPGHNKNNCPLK